MHDKQTKEPYARHTALKSSHTKRSLTLRVILKGLFVLLGVVLLGVLTAQTVTDGWSGHLGIQTAPSDNPVLGLGVVALYVVYLVVTLVRPRRVPWSRWRFTYTYLLSIFALTLVVGSFASPLLRLLGYIVIFGVVIQARDAFGRRGSWLVVGVLVLAILLDVLLTGNVTTDDASAWTPLQLGMWLIGLVFVHTFTGLGVQERTARMHNEELVKELMVAQGQLRIYAVHAEELATMRERTRVAREVHDTLAQGFAAIKMHLETGHALFDEHPILARQHMEQARNLAGEHLREARMSILELRTDALHDQSLLSALTALAAAWRPWRETTTTGATFSTSPEVEKIHIPPVAALAFYRIAQEALNNAFQHGQACHVEVELSIESHTLCLTVTDDGIGFDPAQRNEIGFGIIGMHERVRLLKGDLDILSTPGVGTQVVAMIPLHPTTIAEPSTVGI